MGKLFTRRNLLRLGVFGSGGAVLGYTGLVEPFWVEMVKRKLPIRHLPPGLKGKTLVQISDLHVSGRVSTSFLVKNLDRVSRLSPDIVAYTGDFITLDEQTEIQMEEVFPRLPKGSLGTAAILGNHDYGRNWAEENWARKIIDSLAARKIPVLRNEILEIAGLQIVGLDDLWAERFDLEAGLESLDPERAALVLSHNPDTVDRGDWSKFKGWILAGHTHGGQCKPPFLPPPLLPVTNRKYTHGHIPLSGGRDLYINRALGYLHQVRFNVRPEITVFELC